MQTIHKPMPIPLTDMPQAISSSYTILGCQMVWKQWRQSQSLDDKSIARWSYVSGEPDLVFHLWLSVISHKAHRLTCPWCCTCSRTMAWTASSLCGTACGAENETCMKSTTTTTTTKMLHCVLRDVRNQWAQIFFCYFCVALTMACTWGTWEEGRPGTPTWAPARNCSAPYYSWSQCMQCTRQWPEQNHSP